MKILILLISLMIVASCAVTGKNPGEPSRKISAVEGKFKVVSASIIHVLKHKIADKHFHTVLFKLCFLDNATYSPVGGEIFLEDINDQKRHKRMLDATGCLHTLEEVSFNDKGEASQKVDYRIGHDILGEINVEVTFENEKYKVEHMKYKLNRKLESGFKISFHQY